MRHRSPFFLVSVKWKQLASTVPFLPDTFRSGEWQGGGRGEREGAVSRPHEAEGLSCMDFTPTFSAATQPHGAWTVQESDGNRLSRQEL